MAISTKNNLHLVSVAKHKPELERFKPYQYRPPATFAIILENFLKLIANQFIELGNFLDKTFYHIENPPTKEKITDLVVKEVLPKSEIQHTEVKSKEPSTQPKRNTTSAPPTRLTPQDCLQRYLNDVPGFARTDLSHKVRPSNPHELMLPSVWDEIFKSICERVWLKLPNPKELKPTDIFKNEINTLIRNSFTEDRYRFFEEFYLKNHPDLKIELSRLEKQAKVSGAVSAAAVAGLNYLAGDLLTPNQLTEFMINEAGLTHLSSAAYLLLWGLAILHLTQKMGIKQPSLEDVKKFFKHSFSVNPAVLLDNIYNGCTLQQLKTITYDTAASLLDKIYTSCTKENLLRLGCVAGSLCFERYVNCIKRVTTTGINYLLRRQFSPAIQDPQSKKYEEKAEYFKRKQNEFSSAASARISMTQLGWQGLNFTGNMAYKTASLSKNLFSYLSSFVA
jgi:hypothetical protein